MSVSEGTVLRVAGGREEAHLDIWTGVLARGLEQVRE